MVSSDGTLIGKAGFERDPLAALESDRTALLTDSRLTEKGQAADNARYQIFTSDHPYFTASEILPEEPPETAETESESESETESHPETTENPSTESESVPEAVATPLWQADRTAQYYHGDGSYAGTERTSGADFEIFQSCLTFGEQTGADAYEVQIIRSGTSKGWVDDGSGAPIPAAHDADFVYLEKTEEGAYAVFYTSSDPEFDPAAYAANGGPGSRVNADAVYLGTMAEGQRIGLPYAGAVSAPAAGDRINTVSYVQLLSREDGRMLQVQLPDGESIDGAALAPGASEGSTAQASVRGLVLTEKEKPYLPSKISVWYRTDGGIGSDVAEMTDYGASPEAIGGLGGVSAVRSEREGVAFELKVPSAKNLICEMEVFDGQSLSGGVLYRRYVSAYGFGASGGERCVLLPETIFGGWEHLNFRIRFAYILDGEKYADGTGSGGLSRWSGWQSGLFPEKAKETEETKETAESAETKETGETKETKETGESKETVVQTPPAQTGLPMETVTSSESESSTETEPPIESTSLAETNFPVETVLLQETDSLAETLFLQETAVE